MLYIFVWINVSERPAIACLNTSKKLSGLFLLLGHARFPCGKCRDRRASHKRNDADGSDTEADGLARLCRHFRIALPLQPSE
jgi:hypothetical protein